MNRSAASGQIREVGGAEGVYRCGLYEDAQMTQWCRWGGFTSAGAL